MNLRVRPSLNYFKSPRSLQVTLLFLMITRNTTQSLRTLIALIAEVITFQLERSLALSIL